MAVNIANSNVNAVFSGTGTINGIANILAHTYDEDTSKALATAVGADIQRYLDKFSNGVQSSQSSANKLLSGEYFDSTNKDAKDTSSNNKDNSTASTVNSNLNSSSNNEQSSGSAAAATNNNSLSTNVLRSQNVTAQGTDATGSTTTTGTDTANTQTGGVNNDNTGSSTSITSPQSSSSQSYQVAAAVGLNITGHKANVDVAGNLTAADIAISANNQGNFRTLGTGAAMLLNTQAYTGNFVSLTSTAGSVTVAAADRYELITVVVTAAIGGTAGVGISVLASVSFNTVEAKIGASNTVNAYNSVIVQASSNRNIVSVVASVAGGGVAGVGLSVSVVVAGAAMSQDAHVLGKSQYRGGSGRRGQLRLSVRCGSGDR